MDTITVIKEYITQELLQRNVVLTHQTALIAEGYLTSLQTVELVLFLNERFNIEIDPEEVSEEAFYSLERIADLVARKKAA